MCSKVENGGYEFVRDKEDNVRFSQSAMRTRWPNWAVKMNEAYMNMCAHEIFKVVDDAHVAMVAKRQKMIKAFLKKKPVIWE